MPENVQSHGGIDLQELKSLNIDVKSIIDFSVNSNPYGPFPKVREAIKYVDITRYPDRGCFPLSNMLSDANQVYPEQIIIGNGTVDIIWLAAHAFLSQKKVLIFGPTFGEYQRAASAVGADVIILMADAPNFIYSGDEVCKNIEKYQPDVVFICNPNNPTGQYLPPSSIQYISRMMQERLLIVDEAYRTFLSGVPFEHPMLDNILTLRSLTKDFALAGLRLGYAIGDEKIIQRLREFQPPWSVNNAALAAGEAALSEMEYLHETIAKTRNNAIYLQDAIMKHGYRVIKSEVHYFLIDVKPITGDDFRKKMLHNSIYVRDCTSFGIPDYIRIGTQLPHENDRLITILADRNRLSS